MRIISGKYKGRVFKPSSKLNLRPTTDLAKESIFNFLVNRWDFENLEVLDLFAGIGNISFEFSSRGIKRITAVEINPKHVAFIKDVADKLSTDNIVIYQTDVFSFVNQANTQYNIIFADPPYDLDLAETLPDTIFNKKLLKPSGELLLEHSSKRDFSKHPNYVLTKKYGAVHFSLFEHSGEL